MLRVYSVVGAAAIVACGLLFDWPSRAAADEPSGEDLRATHVEAAPIKFDIGPGGKIETMAMDARGRLLVGVSWIGQKQPAARGDDPGSRPARRPAGGRPARGRRSPLGGDDRGREYAVKVVSPEGKVAATWPIDDMRPKMIHGCPDGTIYICGGGKLARYDTQGRRQTAIDIASALAGQFEGAHTSGVTASDKYFFVAFGHGFSLRATEDIVRFDRDLSSPKLIVRRQYGCCSHIDLDVKDDVLLIAENSRHRVNRFSFDGAPLGSWGRRDRESIAGFTACCNPVNFDFGPGDVLYTAESGVGRVKRYRADGRYLGVVGYVDTTKFDRGSRLAAQSCYIPIEVGHDGKRVYVMDVRSNFIRVLVEKAGG